MANLTQSVLLIDDEILMITVMNRILERLGYKDVDYAADGLTAIEKMRARAYGLVICDWHMEPISGYDVLRHVRGDATLRDIPFIIATTQTVMQNAVAAKIAGVDGYLLKPFTPGSLQRAIEAATGTGPHHPAQRSAAGDRAGSAAVNLGPRQ
jgi:two-component system chemotaxis response regulator CheY